MGSSKLAFIGFVYTMLNIFTFGFNSADNASGTAAYTAGNTIQAEQLVNAGVGLAIIYMGDDTNPTNVSGKAVQMMGDTVTYKVTYVSKEWQNIDHRWVYSADKQDRIVEAKVSVGNAEVTSTVRVYFDKTDEVWKTSKISSQTSINTLSN